jgi:hypothetical protein
MAGHEHALAGVEAKIVSKGHGRTVAAVYDRRTIFQGVVRF